MTNQTYFTPETHQRMIKILTMKLNDIKNLPSQRININALIEKIAWHAEQYTIKTGELPA